MAMTMRRSATRAAGKARGFTLVELMVVIFVVAILSGIAWPSMTSLMLKHRVQDAATDLFSALFKARSEALKRVAAVSIRPISGTDWTTGWQIQDASSNVLDSHGALQRITLTTAPASLSAVTYSATGRVTTSAPTFALTATNGSYSCTYTVTVDPSGRPYETTARRSGSAQVTGGGVPSC